MFEEFSGVPELERAGAGPGSLGEPTAPSWIAGLAPAKILAAAGFCAGRDGDAAAAWAAAAGLAAARRVVAAGALALEAASCFPAPDFPAVAWADALVETVSAAARCLAVPVLAAALARRAAALFFGGATGACCAAFLAGAFFRAAGFAAETELSRRRAAAAAFVRALRPAFDGFFAASVREGALRLVLSGDDPFDGFALGVPGCFACFALEGLKVFLTDAIASALLFPALLWRQGGI